MFHAGIGATHLNAFLTAVNIPPYSTSALSKRQQEVGHALENVARTSCAESASLERSLEAETRNADLSQIDYLDIAVSYDMMWMKRGRAQNSLVGFGSVMGVHTGNVLDYDVCNKKCRKCDNSQKTGTSVEHTCKKNYFGSSKGMEAHTASKLFLRSKDRGLKYKTLIGDDDSSTIARLRSEVDPEIIKVSDPTHTKRTLNGKLSAIKKSFKELSQTVIGYIELCFRAAIRQNEGNPEGLAKALNAIPPHMFGDHSECSDQWCGYLKDPNSYKHRGLPYGRDLENAELKKELTVILSTYAKNADKLSKRGSSQQNESLHNTIGSKYLKIRDYSAGSADFRIAAGVAQKNIGYKYVSDVMESMNLSPGKFTQSHAARMDERKRKAQQHRKTPQAKRRRVILKSDRAQRQADAETRDGSTYQTGVGLEENQDFSKIPDRTPTPLSVSLSEQELDDGHIVLYDLETTGTGRK